VAVPSWQFFIDPALKTLANADVLHHRKVADLVADRLQLSDDDRNLALPSQKQPQYVNRNGWALSALGKAGMITQGGERGQWRITEAGKEFLSNHPASITEKTLLDIPQYADYHRQSRQRIKEEHADTSIDADIGDENYIDPETLIDTGISRIHAEVADSLLHRLHEKEPVFFEMAVLELLMKMGYGGAEGTATQTQISNDGGIDGIIDQDALGLARIYVQAKRYDPSASVSRPDIQSFVGALAGKSANQGVFLTTAKFSQGAQEYANSVAARVVLIDGNRLTRLMIKYGVGVQVKQQLEIVAIDEDFFD
jgi:restriction system protein